ncbi:L-histidine N(alpha)-methyltransferase [Nocardia alni]|uniref:L-histidine N(alpha)-methyltransferase n=1 Tax=Nocardia alni TaxID=2815723 RepID=UPI001C23D4BD|nr:L-histidine N(alpha)-methyltransferase [Nocardia alni]
MRTKIQPKSELYQLLTPQQIADLAESLIEHRELPRQYGYVGTGAQHWNQQSTEELSPATNRLLNADQAYLSELISRRERWDVVDLGAGNGLPARPLLSWLVDAGRMGRYVATDISADMLRMAEHNIRTWFDGAVPFEGHIIDLARQPFATHVGRTPRLVLHFGNTLFNLRNRDQAFGMVHDNMTANDFLIQEQYVDSPQDRLTRSARNLGPAQRLPPGRRFLVDLLGIGEDLYTLESGYDLQRSERFERIRLTTGASIRFDAGPVVDLDAGESLLVIRNPIHGRAESLAKLGEYGFTTPHVHHSDDERRLLTVSTVA